MKICEICGEDHSLERICDSQDICIDCYNNLEMKTCDEQMKNIFSFSPDYINEIPVENCDKVTAEYGKSWFRDEVREYYFDPHNPVWDIVFHDPTSGEWWKMKKSEQKKLDEILLSIDSMLEWRRKCYEKIL